MTPWEIAALASEARFNKLCAMGTGLVPANMMERLGSDVARTNEIIATVAATMVMPMTAPNSKVLSRTRYDWQMAGVAMMQNTGEAAEQVSMFEKMLNDAKAKHTAAAAAQAAHQAAAPQGTPSTP